MDTKDQATLLIERIESADPSDLFPHEPTAEDVQFAKIGLGLMETIRGMLNEHGFSFSLQLTPLRKSFCLWADLRDGRPDPLRLQVDVLHCELLRFIIAKREWWNDTAQYQHCQPDFSRQSGVEFVDGVWRLSNPEEACDLLAQSVDFLLQPAETSGETGTPNG